MKATEVNEIRFRPINVRIETEEELRAIIACLNVPEGTVNQHSSWGPIDSDTQCRCYRALKPYAEYLRTRP